jgi:ABC-type bacteriocin/lantibiotic exporter with double-glycine peptidase domain
MQLKVSNKIRYEDVRFNFSLERIEAYMNIDHEPCSSESGTPPAYWPSSGEVRVEKLSARYSKDGPEVLHDLSFHVKSGERIGVGKCP